MCGQAGLLPAFLQSHPLSWLGCRVTQGGFAHRGGPGGSGLQGWKRGSRTAVNPLSSPSLGTQDLPSSQCTEGGARVELSRANRGSLPSPHPHWVWERAASSHYRTSGPSLPVQPWATKRRNRGHLWHKAGWRRRPWMRNLVQALFPLSAEICALGLAYKNCRYLALSDLQNGYFTWLN